MPNKNIQSGQEIHSQIVHALDEALASAEVFFNSQGEPDYALSSILKTSLSTLSMKAQRASTAFTNIVTCLAIKSALPNIDIRYHQVQIQNQTSRGAGFSFRPVSESTIYPWLKRHAFEGARSGFQTRTFERPKPYMLDYDENIGDIKEPFLTVFDQIENNNQSATDALSYILYLQLIQRDSKNIILSIPRTQDIHLIVDVFKKHFFYNYKESRGASRLPVLALYSIYSILIEQMERFTGMELKELEEHSAADAQTGAVGDIEIINSQTKEVFEAIEVKHNIVLSEVIIQDVVNKIMNKSVNRYYILTTHSICEPDEDLFRMIEQVKSLYNCQVIANGVLPTIKYYLRLMSDPSIVFRKYVSLLETDTTIKHEHREVWNSIAIS